MVDPVCPHCGYELVGLPRRGHCPECGKYYDQLASPRAAERAAEARRVFWLRRTRTIFVALIALSFLMCSGYFAWSPPSGSGPNRPMFAGLLCTGLAVLATIASYLYERDSNDDPFADDDEL